MKYEEFLNSKSYRYEDTGFDVNIEDLNSNLFDFQKYQIRWALKKGKCAVFNDTGLGKTIIQLEFAHQVVKHTNKPVLILAPLAVSQQTVTEGEKFGIKVNMCNSKDDVVIGVNITNYEKLHKFDASVFVGIVLDESSIIKSFVGKYATELISEFRSTPYKLACTATPSPNDHQELGAHAEFLNVMRKPEMLATYFINDAQEGHWRIKRHAEVNFWKWVSSWASLIKNPADLGFTNPSFELPALNTNLIKVASPVADGRLLSGVAITLPERRNARISSIPKKIVKIKELVDKLDNAVIWCDYNLESSEINKAIPNVVEVTGSNTNEYKEDKLLKFASGDIKYLVSKPKICGFGMNFQKCNNIIFCGMSDSYEQFYQAIRRCYRFGQTKEVNVYIVLSESEMSIYNNVKLKHIKHNKMADCMVDSTVSSVKHQLLGDEVVKVEYAPINNLKLPTWIK